MTQSSQGRMKVPPPAIPPISDRWLAYRLSRADQARLERSIRMGGGIEETKRRIAVQRARVLDQRNALIETHLPVLNNIAERMSYRLPRFVEREDLVLSGVPALISAVERFRPARGNKFETFAAPRLRGAILDALRAQDQVPRLTRQRNGLKTQAEESFRKSYGRPPDAEELRLQLRDQDTKERERILQEPAIPTSISIESESRQGRDADTMMFREHLADNRGSDPLSDTVRKDLKQFLTERLDRRDRLMVILYYMEGMTMQEVGVTLGVSESRVSQSMKQVIAQLKSRMSLRKEELCADVGMVKARK